MHLECLLMFVLTIVELGGRRFIDKYCFSLSSIYLGNVMFLNFRVLYIPLA